MSKIKYNNMLFLNLIFFASPSWGTGIDLQIDLRAYDNSLTIPDAIVFVDGHKEPAKPSGGGYGFALDKFDADEQIDVELNSANDYLKRTVGLRRLPDEQDRISRSIEVYLVKNNQNVSYPILDTAAGELDNKVKLNHNVSKEFAIFESAFLKLSADNRKSQYGLKTRYNYARTLLEHCKEGFATCTAAKDYCSELETEHPTNSLMLKENISIDELHKCQIIADQVIENEDERDLVLEWKQVEEAFEEGGEGYLTAGDRAKEICDNYGENEESWRKIGRPHFAVCGDAGVAYLKYWDYVVQRANKPVEPGKYLALRENLWVKRGKIIG